jgi:hypothetical protein
MSEIHHGRRAHPWRPATQLGASELLSYLIQQEIGSVLDLDGRAVRPI